MAAISPGSASRLPKRANKPTQTTKQHRFEPFTRRIARLKIDPVHRIARRVGGGGSNQTEGSHFQFSQKATPLCETLPQLLYHADTLASLLLEYIGKRDVLSLESLLSLLAHFAHDLGPKFEKYFSDSVSLVADVAATHDAPEAIEWSFTCLAWIFKFLSKLLVPDLRPLLGIMVKYLGKSHQKEYVTRFAAESMAYLLRRAAMLYAKNQRSLQIAMQYIIGTLEEIEDQRDLALYQHGIMTLLSDTVKGVDNTIHEDGLAVIQCLIDYIRSGQSTSARSDDVLLGIWTNILHHTTAKTASPLVELMQAQLQNVQSSEDITAIQLIIPLVFVTIATRKASRIQNWPAFNNFLLEFAQWVGSIPDNQGDHRKILITTLALSVCYSPLDGLFTAVNPLQKLVLSDGFSRHGTLFFSLLSKLCPGRLSQFFAQTLQDFLDKQWKTQEHSLLAFLLELQTDGTDSENAISSIAISRDWKSHMIHQLQQGPHDMDTAVVASSYASAVAKSRNLRGQTDEITVVLGRILKDACTVRPSVSDPWTRFALGNAFSAYNDLTGASEKFDRSFDQTIVDEIPGLRTYPAFLDAVLRHMGLPDLILTADQLSNTVSAMIENLLLDDVSIKQTSLVFLGRVADEVKIPQEILDTCSDILKIPYGLQTVRELSMLIRNLANLWDTSEAESKWNILIPYFLLGLLSPKAPQLHEDICQALATISTSPVGEPVVTGILSTWLQIESDSPENKKSDSRSGDTHLQLTPFQCLNIENIRELTKTCSTLLDNAFEALRGGFERHHQLVSLNHSAARSLAIRFFQAVPRLAEKNSRQIVPLLLSSINFDSPSDWSPPSDSSTTSATLSAHEKVQSWTRQDRKALLNLFAMFQNPKVLFRSSDVFNALLDVLAKGDVEMQKLALKGIFTFKNPSIRPYEEHLQNLTDDKRFRDELTVFFHADPESTNVDEAHRKDLFPVILRLLYGQMINRSGSQSNRGGQEARRKLILRTLFRLEEEEIREFYVIGCGPLTDFTMNNYASNRQHTLSYDVLSPARQYGLLNMLETSIETLQGDLEPYAELLQRAIAYCLLRASKKLNGSTTDDLDPDEGMSWRIRRLGIRCLELLFLHCPELKWDDWAPLIFEEIINPRLEKFPVETAQGVSGLLRLFCAWASNSRSVTLFNGYNDSLLPTISDCLVVPSAKDEVKIFVLKEILVRLCQTVQSSTPEEHDECRLVLDRHVNSILATLDDVLRQNPSRAVQDAVIMALSAMTTFATSAESSYRLLSPLTLILRQPVEKVSPQTKGRLLQALLNLLSVPGHELPKDTFSQLLDTVSLLFNYFRDRINRSLLVQILARLADLERDLQGSSDLCGELNAYSTTRLDEVDYDRRLAAFTTISDTGVSGYSPMQWTPILQNIIYFCRDEDDFAIRSNAVAVLKIFIQQSASNDNEASITTLRREVVYPALKKGLKATSESVRADHLAMLGVTVQHDREWEAVKDMEGLLANNDEEASFFTNALHIQQHRRLRALRRLESEVHSGIISSTNVTTIFLPLLEHFIFELDEDPSAQNLAGQAIVAVGVCLQEAEWGQYKAIFRRYESYMKSKPEVEKNVIKLISIATNSLYRSAPWISEQDAIAQDVSPTQHSDHVSRLVKTLPRQEKVSEELAASFIPNLAAFVHQKEESEISLRIPIAISTVRLIKMLPETQISLLLPPVLLDVSNILRSRVQESRDVARKTLAEMSAILGAPCFGYILKELRTSLARGYQLHVLSYTVHSILVSMTDRLKPGELDYCLPTLVTIIMEDTFGAVGQEKSAEDYISKMREVKSSKSYDSMELLARISTVRHLIELIKPIQKLLVESLTTKQANQIDDLLRRVNVGLSRNPEAGSRDILIFSYEIIQEFYKQRVQIDSKVKRPTNRNDDRFLVDLKAGRARQPGHSTSVFTYKLILFGLDLLRSVLAKHTELLTAENVHSFVPIIGDALVEGQEDVMISAMRLLSAIIKLPVEELDRNALLYAMQGVKVIKESTSTNTELSQAALKLVTAILRERRGADIRDTDIGYVIHRITPDLDEPDRQGVTFNFVKAVMARKIIVPELYDLVEQTGSMMVTNQTRGTRDAARGVYIHFLLDYPQSKSRWSKQIKFLAKNLDYQYPEGRQSVMEAIHVLLGKSGDEIAQQLVGSFFIPVLLIMSNDDSAQCREMAAALLGQLFVKADTDQAKSFVVSLRSWVEQVDNAALVKAGMQAFTIYFEAGIPGAKNELAFVRTRIEEALRNDYGDAEADSWEPTFFALQLLTKLCATFPDEIMSRNQASLWQEVFQLLDHHHPWVQHSTSKLIGSFFSDLGRANAGSGLQNIPLSNARGLCLTADKMTRVLMFSLRTVKRARAPEDLRMQTVRNLVFLSRCFILNGLVMENPVETRRLEDEESEPASEPDEESERDDEQASAIQFMLNQIAAVLRREPSALKVHCLTPKTSALQLLAAVINHIPAESSAITSLLGESVLHMVLLPLVHLTDPSLPPPRTPDQDFQTAYRDLITSATQVLDLLQTKIGNKAYVEQMSAVQRLVRKRRDERAQKRKVERVADPERYGLEKRRKRQGEQRRKKERASEMRGRRRGY